MQDFIIEAFIDSLKLLPFLLFIYFFIEWIEFRWSEKIEDFVKKAGNWGPLLGAFFGVIPQCGFSVVSTALFSKKYITMGTLLAVYLSTSDEAIPVILSRPEQAGLLFPLIGTKLLLAVSAGFLVDFFYNRNHRRIHEHKNQWEDSHQHNHEHGKQDHVHNSGYVQPYEHETGSNSISTSEIGCCGHTCAPGGNKELLIHPLIHTAKVFIFVLVVNLLMNIGIYYIGEDNLGNVLLKGSFLQLVLTALVGLIPNCAASVAITEAYLMGGISFGSIIAGLSTNSGLGLMILFRENKNRRENFVILGLLFGMSIVAGWLIQVFVG